MADGLRRLDGVADVEVDLQRNLCTITPDPTRLLALEGVPAAVRQAGFRPGGLWIEADGELAGGDGDATFTIRGGGPTLPVQLREPVTMPVRLRYESDPPRLSGPAGPR